MGKSELTSIAAATMSFVATVAFIFIPNIGPNSPWHVQLAFAAGGLVGLYGVFVVAQWLLLRYYYGDLLGEWFYSTTPHEDVRFHDVNFALMTFKLSFFDGDLCYGVDLYESLAQLRSRTQQRRGHARSLALTYSVDQKCVELVYLVEYRTGRPEDLTRKGRLSLHFGPGGLLEGDYISEVWESEGSDRRRTVSSGKMIAARTIYELEKAIEGAPDPA